MVVLLYRFFLSQIFLRFIRLLITFPAIGRYVNVVFDPNWIRRHSSYEVPEFFVAQKYGTTSYIVDISDHIGYISYMRRELPPHVRDVTYMVTDIHDVRSSTILLCNKKFRDFVRRMPANPIGIENNVHIPPNRGKRNKKANEPQENL